MGGEDTANSTLDHTLPPLSARARDLLCSHQLLSQDRSCPQKTPTLEDCLEIGANSSLASPSCPHTFDSPLCLPSTSGDQQLRCYYCLCSHITIIVTYYSCRSSEVVLCPGIVSLPSEWRGVFVGDHLGRLWLCRESLPSCLSPRPSPDCPLPSVLG